ncbi:HAD family phosphatase [Streptomyces sp. NPDC006700]|uniref:HAD family hydrolase n=1 Tax=unclassified Streptomyces TaxID=2593676 RepID=UPI0033CC932E
MSDASAAPRPAWLLSDFAGVLGQHQPEQARRRMAAVAGAGFTPFWDAYWAERQPYDAGEVTRDAYWTNVAARLGTGWPPELIRTLDTMDVASWLFPDRETLRVADELLASGVRLAVLSNAPLSLAAALHELPWLAAFEEVICSSEINAAKPEPGCYRRALDILGASAGEVVFVDDREANVSGAKALGIRAFLFSDAGRLRRDLLR